MKGKIAANSKLKLTTTAASAKDAAKRPAAATGSPIKRPSPAKKETVATILTPEPPAVEPEEPKVNGEAVVAANGTADPADPSGNPNVLGTPVPDSDAERASATATPVENDNATSIPVNGEA